MRPILNPAPAIVAVIGGGPAGLMAAETLAASGCRVTVYEQMPSSARKFLMAGRGGLNLTHSEPLEPFLARYGAARTRLRKAIEAFPPAALQAWCEGLGEPTFVGSSGRVFPKSFKASPLLRAWLTRLAARGVTIKPRHRWMGWDGDESIFQTPDGLFRAKADAMVLAMGGASWPRLGSDGNWVSILQRAAIEIAPLRPTNCGVRIAWSDDFRAKVAGCPLKRIALTCAGRTVKGEALITQHGLEGGAIYAISPFLRDQGDLATLTIDLRPDMTQESLAIRLRQARKGQTLSNTLRKAAGLDRAAMGLLREATGNKLPKDELTLAGLIKAAPLCVTGTDELKRAISTAGGVLLDCIDECWMLKARPGTFVAGEMLDWEAPTGGYLLQASFATGLAAARGALCWLSKNTAFACRFAE